jgi:uncharacterized 2Fe-2S/4Fe-4S cluster protein (DUF4445 family)
MAGGSLLDHARHNPDASSAIATSCNGQGTCGECIVQVLEGHEALTPPTPEEAAVVGSGGRSGGPTYRLACQARIADTAVDVVVATMRRNIRVLTRARRGHEAALQPRVRRVGDRIGIGPSWAPAGEGRLLGLALDVGTTTVAAELVDLRCGATIATAVLENPQRLGGSDVISRIGFDGRSPGVLRRVLIGHVNRLVAALPCGTEEIYEVIVAGNPTMRDLLFGLDVQPLGMSPFVSVTERETRDDARESSALDVPAVELGLRLNSAARAYGLPLVACHVGADAAAAMLVTRIWDSGEPIMVIDVGTNTELLCGDHRRVLAASAPAGPAFEGGGVSCGMPAMEGAIESFRFEDGRARWRTVGDRPPLGVCGSGLVDLLGELVRTGRIDPQGRFIGGSSPLTVDPGSRLALREADVAALAQAKGAIAAGQAILLRKLGIGADGIGTLFLAGGFAEYLDVSQAQRIGLLIPVPPARVVKLGNAALAGARIALCNEPARRTLEQQARLVEHVQLEQDPEFFDLFVEGMRFLAATGGSV